MEVSYLESLEYRKFLFSPNMNNNNNYKKKIIKQKKNVINDNCSICSKPILFRKNSQYPKNDLCSICWNENKRFHQKKIRSRNSPIQFNNFQSGRNVRPHQKEADCVNDFTWGEYFNQINVSKYNINYRDSEEDLSCKVTSTTSYAPERPSLNMIKYNPFKDDFMDSKHSLEDNTAITKPVSKHKAIVFDGQTHSNKKFKLIVRKSPEIPENEESAEEDINLVIDTQYSDKEDLEQVYNEPVIRDPRLRKEESDFKKKIIRDPRLSKDSTSFNSTVYKADEEPICIKQERVDNYPEIPLHLKPIDNYSEIPLNLKPFILEVFIEGIRFEADIDTSLVELQMSMNIGEVIQQEIIDDPKRSHHRNGWSNLYPGKTVPVPLKINNFLNIVSGTLRSDIHDKIVLGREVFATFGFNFTVCGLPVKQMD